MCLANLISDNGVAQLIGTKLSISDFNSFSSQDSSSAPTLSAFHLRSPVKSVTYLGCTFLNNLLYVGTLCTKWWRPSVASIVANFSSHHWKNQSKKGVKLLRVPNQEISALIVYQ